MKTSVLSISILAAFLSAGAWAAEPERPAAATPWTAPPDRPIGVEADDWIMISEKLGFVVVATTEAMPEIQGPNPTLLLNRIAPDPAAKGYFMIKGANGWRRLVVMTPSDIAAVARN
jgi:hypothetical protein